MRKQQIFFSLTTLVLSFFLFGFGFFLAFASLTSAGLEKIYATFFEPERIFWSGCFLMAFSASCLFLYGLLSKRRYFLIKMGGMVSVHEKILSQIVTETLASLFPNQPILCDVIVRRKNRVEILADIPESEAKADVVLDKMEQELTAALLKCGVEKEFILNVRFTK